MVGLRRTTSSRPGEVTLSRLDLNVENGAIEEPRRPMVRLIARVATGVPRRARQWLHGAARRALDRLDFDDLGAEVSQQRTAERAGPDLGDLESADACERQRMRRAARRCASHPSRCR